MPLMTESPRTGTKCYIHEMQRPLDLPYKRLQYHICRFCQARLLELAKADFQFKLRDQVVAVSITTEVQQKAAGPEKGYEATKTPRVKKEAT